MRRRLTAGLAGLVAGLVAALVLTPRANSQDLLGTPPPFAGQFFAVDVRPITDLPTRPTGIDPPVPVRLADDLRWWDGTTCDGWSARGLPALDTVLGDPALADLLIGPVGEPGMFQDHRRGDTFAIDCQDRAVATVVRIDDRVLVDVHPELGQYVVIERELLYEDVVRLQRLLAEAGFDPGPADGDMGPRTRDAVARYAAWRLDDTAPPSTGVVTSNLLDGLSFSAHD